MINFSSVDDSDVDESLESEPDPEEEPLELEELDARPRLTPVPGIVLGNKNTSNN